MLVLGLALTRRVCRRALLLTAQRNWLEEARRIGLTARGGGKLREERERRGGERERERDGERQGGRGRERAW